MRVAEYRELIDAVVLAHASLRSAASGHEQRTEAGHLQLAINRLRSARRPPRLSDYDADRARRVLEAAAEKLGQFREADAAFARLAFGAEWR